MKLLRFLVLFLFGLSSCQEPPSCAIPEDKLILVLADVQVAEAAAQNLMGERKDSILALYYGQIYTIHGVSEEEFLACFDALQSDPERMSVLYERVLERLSLQQAQVPGEKVKEEED